MSTIKSISCVAVALMAPPAPAGTMPAAASTTAGFEKLSVDTFGCAVAAGQTVKYPGFVVLGWTVKLSDQAAAFAGTGHIVLAGSGIVRTVPAAMYGDPKVLLTG